MQPISHLLLEMFVLSKPYFDREGMIVAEVDGRVVGFAHAGFGPNADGSDISTQIGLICLIIVQAHQQRHEIMQGLLGRGEDYLRRHGARELQVGGSFPLSPFYLGLYGGSDLPGILQQDQEMDRFFREQGYVEFDRSFGYERSLDGFRPPVDRRALQHRRENILIRQVNPKETSWWEACVFGPTDRIRFLLVSKVNDQLCGQITFWDMGPLSTRPLSGGMGLINMQIAEPLRRKGLGLFLATESLKHLQSTGIQRVETQTLGGNEAGLKMLDKLGFSRLRVGTLFRKPDAS
jgi:RimJ/RimL family protein N-acetyltransferase